MSIGERIVTRYVKHPPAASGYLDDGDPLDSGTAHIVHSNLSHLAERNTRLVAHAVGPGEIDGNSVDWSGIIDASEDDTDDFATIPWDRQNTGWCCGPIVFAHSRLGTSPAGFYPRKIRVVVQAHKSTENPSELQVLAALTVTPSPPLVAARYASASVTKTNAASGALVLVLDLECDRPVRPTQGWRCRDSGADDPAAAIVTPAWVWVGWKTTALAIPDRIESLSVFEVWA